MGLFSQKLDAIAVPTNRSPDYLGYALKLAKKTNAFLFVLCSGQSSAAEVTKHLAAGGVHGIAVDIPADYQHPLFSGFETSNFADARLGRIACDLDLKRNLCLVVGRVAGWRNLLFLDDDITHITGLDRGITLSADTPAVGFLVNDYPDNSVLRQAERLGGSEPGVKMSAGAMIVNLHATAAFFPHIYNEDWFFINATPASAIAGTANQRSYDPFRPLRAMSEEFGDLLAEGMLQLAEVGLDWRESGASDWEHLHITRKLLNTRIRKQLERQRRSQPVQAALDSLTAAERRLDDITVQACTDYLTAWNRDLDLFRMRFSLLTHQEASVTQILHAMGLKTPEPTLTANY